MNRRAFIVGFLPILLAASTATIRPSFAAETPQLRAGAAAVDITPEAFPLNMPGGFSANMAERAHDPLHARALVLSQGETTVVLAVVDNLGASPEVLDEAKERASQKTGIPVERMLVCSTHTHSGPPSNVKEGPVQAVAYRKQFITGLADAIVRAHAALQPAGIGAAVDTLPDEVFNRRWYLKPGKMPPNPYGKFDTVKMNPGTSPDVLDRPAGPTDPDVTIFSVQDAKRRPVALFANYALHYVGGTPEGEMSADYFGEFARLMPSRVRGDGAFVALLSNGASGDINNIPFNTVRPPREPFEQIRIVAQKTADAAWRARQKIETHRTDARLAMLERKVELKYRRPSAEELIEARRVAAIKDPAEVEKLPRLAQNYARSMIAAAERSEESLTVQVQAIRIGDAAVCGVPFETFVEIGLELKQRSPFRPTMVIGLANGRHGYLPTPEQHALGGYETWLGTNYVQPDASVILTRHLLEMLAELK